MLNYTKYTSFGNLRVTGKQYNHNDKPLKAWTTCHSTLQHLTLTLVLLWTYSFTCFNTVLLYWRTVAVQITEWMVFCNKNLDIKVSAHDTFLEKSSSGDAQSQTMESQIKYTKE